MSSAIHQPNPRRRRDGTHRVPSANQDLQALQAVTDIALSHLSLDDLLTALLERITDVLGVDNAAVLLLDSAGQTLTVQAVHGLEEMVAAQVRVPVGQGFAGRIVATGEPLVVDDITTFPVANPFLREQLHSVAGVPLVNSQLVGVLHIGTVLPRHFTAHDVHLLQQVADRMALAIDRARLYRAELQAREQLAERVAQLEAIMEAVPEILTVYDAAGCIVVSNATHKEQLARFFLETPPSETVRQRFEQVGGVYDARGVKLEEAAWPQTRVLRGEVLAGAKAAELSMRMPQDEDEMAIFSVTGAPLYNADGHIIGAVTVSHDITEQKQLERERRERAEQLDRIFESIADGVVIYDTQAQPVRLNAAARRILSLDPVPAGYAQRPFSERVSLLEAHDEQGRSIALEDWPLMRVLHGQVSGGDTGEVRLRTLDGREVELSLSVAPLRDGAGHLTGAVGVFRDQTEHKRLAREREAARAHELALEDTARNMDEFLATASHDLRTPLTVVKNQVQLVLRRLTRLQERAATHTDARLDAEIEAFHESLLAANRNTDRLIRLVAVLFDVARARSGMLELELVPCDLTELVHKHVAAQQAAVPARRIELEVPEVVVLVEADADRLGQALSNYLSNALKYSPADQPVTVRLEVMQNQAVVSVTDHGPGLPPEEQNRIWESFHRAPGIEIQSESGEASGSLGLGLHICKQLVELHPGGVVGVESVVGKGSTFWFRLPLAHSLYYS